MAVETLEITNFTGQLTRRADGDIRSGFAKYLRTFGHDPFTKPGNLTWFETPTRVDSGGTVITDLIMAAKPRLESGITYVYAIGHTGRLYKIQVNDPTTYNPNYDNPVLLATLASNSPTFKYGASIQFFGSTERIYIGHDVGVTRIDFNGTNETFVGVAGSYTASVPRPSVGFIGKLYFGNGTNLVEIDSSATVTTYSKLSPALPVGTTIRDLDVSPDLNYIQIVSSRVPSPDMTVATQDTASLSSGDSYLSLWNGEDGGVTAGSTYDSYSINANLSYGTSSYTMGYDLGGAALYSGNEKIVSLPNSLSPNFGALFATGNLLGFGAPEQDNNVLKGSLITYGQFDEEIPTGLFRLFRISATTQTDILQMPLCVVVSNLFYGSSYAGYSGNQVGSAKVYFSTLEGTTGPSATGKLYKFTTVPTGLGSAIAGVYETQTQLFSKKITVKQIRIYAEPWVANNSFTLALIGSDGGIITNGSKTFTAQNTNVSEPMYIGTDYAWWNPEVASTYALALRITNAGTENFTVTKIEIDYAIGGN